MKDSDTADCESPSEAEQPSVMKGRTEHHCPTCDIANAMRTIRGALDVMDGAHEAWLDTSEEHAMGHAEYERMRGDLNDLKAWLVKRAREGHHRAAEPRIEAAERIAWILGGNYKRTEGAQTGKAEA